MHTQTTRKRYVYFLHQLFSKLFFAVRTVALFSQNVILILKNDLNNKWGGGRNHFVVYSCFLVIEIVKVHWKGTPGNLLMKSEKQTRTKNLKDRLKKQFKIHFIKMYSSLK